jgi:hypothetical protein
MLVRPEAALAGLWSRPRQDRPTRPSRPFPIFDGGGRSREPGSCQKRNRVYPANSTLCPIPPKQAGLDEVATSSEGVGGAAPFTSVLAIAMSLAASTAQEVKMSIYEELKTETQIATRERLANSAAVDKFADKLHRELQDY